jgi:hypothetical protein
MDGAVYSRHPCHSDCADRSASCGVLAGTEAPPPERPGESPAAQVQIRFTADSARLRPGECASLAWDAVDGFQVELDWERVERTGERQVRRRRPPTG